MEEELNIAAILKDKPDARLWSPAIGECSFRSITLDGFISVKADSVIDYWFSTDGRLYREGECLLFPSKQMQDWQKFAWKKGDVLSCGADNLCIFRGWGNDEYTGFKAEFVTPGYTGAHLNTDRWNKVENKDTIKQYIHKIEEARDGKLNLETLEIEHPKQEFKDGDIVVYDEDKGKNFAKIVAIYKTITSGGIDSYAYFNVSRQDIIFDYCSLDFGRVLRLATEEEKQQLFSALAKEGKRWNPETKTIENLPKKCEFKAFDKVLVRDDDAETWIATLFGLYDKEFEIYVCMSNVWKQCIPYNEETAHLLGTTDEYKPKNK